MREMKDSGIEGIDLVPESWDRVQLEHCAYVIRGGSPRPIEQYMSDTDKGYLWIKIGDTEKGNKYITHVREKIISAGLSKTRYVKAGTLLLTNSMSFGEPYILKVNGCIHDGWLAFSNLRFVDKEFLYYFLVSPACRVQFEKASDGGVVQNLNIDKVKHSIIYFPSVLEQQAIVAFLDSKCAEIDALFTDIQSEIETLEAYKRSVITEAVTKGLDKNVPMKESGMSWIGNVPEHWRVEKGKYHLQRKEPRNPGNQQILSVYREYGVIPKDSRDDNHNVTSEDTSKYKYVRPGNLVINKMKAWQGSMGVSKYEGVVSPAYFIYHFVDNELIPKYLHYLFRTCYKDEFRRISGGIREGQWDLSPEAFNNTMLLLPSVKEQASIVAYVDSISTEINSLIAKKQEQLAVLADYKKSVIYEYVTGKKEVPVA